jgi:DNA polymerase III subunit delta
MAASVPIWLFTGPEIGERNTAVEQIRATAGKARGNLDYHTLYASDVRIGDVVSLLQNGSLFADARFVVLRNADEIKKKEDIEMLSAWIAESAGSEEAYLVLVSDEIGIDKKLEALVPKEQKRIFWELFENRKEQWIADYFRKAGMSIEENAVASILDLVENNTDALKNACSRFTLFFPEGHRITEADTDNMLSHNREESAFTLFDDLAQGNLEGALGIFAKLSMSKESSPVQTIAGLTFCFRRLSDWHRLSASGETDEFSLKKAGFTSKKAIEQYRAASRRWDAPAVLRILSLLAQTDLSLRSGGGAIQNVQMEACLYAIHSRRGWPVAVPEYT